MYLNIVATDANTPEYRTYRYEWAGKDAPDPMPYDPATKMKAQMVTIDPATPSYEDFYMWQLNKTVRYLTDDGKFPIHCYLDCTASHRGYMKRLYTIMKAVHPLNQVFVHMSGDNNMYAWAFADWLIEGEENTANYHAAGRATRRCRRTTPASSTCRRSPAATRRSPLATSSSCTSSGAGRTRSRAGASVGPAVHPRRHDLGRGRPGQQAGARRPGMGRAGGVRSVLAQGYRHPRDLARPAA